jgi:hypothetical protein
VAYTEICVAGSWDMVNWMKYSSVNNSFSSSNANATAVVKFSQARKNECGEIQQNGKWLWDISLPQCQLPPLADNQNYGVGHPSALVKAPRPDEPPSQPVSLYYYDSEPIRPPATGPSTRRLATWDGVHFWDTGITNLVGAMSVRYQANAHQYVVTYQDSGENMFKYSGDDGLEFYGQGSGHEWWTLGLWMPIYAGPDAVYDGSLVADEYGRFYSWIVPFVSSEGNWSAYPDSSSWNMYLFGGPSAGFYGF